ncbi:MAG: hypothetical protein ABW047_15555 [Nitrospiraceae bacterium]
MGVPFKRFRQSTVLHCRVAVRREEVREFFIDTGTGMRTAREVLDSRQGYQNEKRWPDDHKSGEDKHG